MNRRMLIGVDVMFLAVCVIAAVLALDFAEGARAFPLYISLVATPLAVANLFQDLRNQHESDEHQHKNALDSIELRKAAKWLGYIVAYALAVLLLGMAVATTIWLVYFLRKYGRARYGYIILSVACVLGALYLLNRFLNIMLPTGIFW